MIDTHETAPRIPAEVFPPGEFIREELEARGWTQADLAAILGRPPRLVNELVNGKRGITPETAQELAQAFGTSAQLWMNLDSSYRLAQVAPHDDAIARRARLFEKAPVKDMIRRGWIHGSPNPEVLEEQLLKFFGIASLDEEPRLWAHAARKSASYGAVTDAQWAWLCRARQLARAVRADAFTERRFADCLSRLRSCLASEQEIRKVPGLLADAGIRFVIVQHLSHTKIDGACFWLDRRSPVITLSLRSDRIDAFWYTLLHELGHVKYKDGLSNDSRPLDVELADSIKNDARPAVEKRADRFATSFLVEPRQLNRFVAQTAPRYSIQRVKRFARQVHVHPGTVTGQLQFRGEVPYSFGHGLLVKVRDIVISAALTDGWGSAPSL